MKAEVYPRSGAVGYSIVPNDDSGKPEMQMKGNFGGKMKSSQSDEERSQSAVQHDATSETEGSPTPATVAFAIASYVTVSLTIVYFNWWLFTTSFRYPVFVSWLQQVVGFVAVTAFAQLGKRYPVFSRSKAVWPQYETCVRVLPLTLSFVGMVGLANICLKFVQVSTYQVARSLTILFTMALSWLILGEIQRRPTIAACGVMVLGFLIGSLDASTLSFGGVVAGGISSAFQALYNVAIKRTLAYVNNDPNLLLFYNLVLSSFLFIPVIFLAGEGAVFGQLIWSPHVPGFCEQWASLAMSGILATLVNLTSYWCIKVTSPLTFNIVGFTKSVLQSVGGIAFLGDKVSAQSLTGIVLSLLGSGWYSQIKVSDAAKERAESAVAGAQREPDLESPQFKDTVGSFDVQMQEVSFVDHSQRQNIALSRGSSARGVMVI